MTLTVHLHTILQRQTPDGLIDRLEVNLPDGSAVLDLLNHLEITMHPDTMLLVVNGRIVDSDRVLEDGDRVNLMPAISGG